MARSRTLGNLRSDVRERCDMVSDQYVTDATFNEYINQSAARLYNKIDAACEGFYSSTSTFTTTSATTYNLPSDFYRLQIAQIDFAGRKQTLRRFELKEAARWSESPSQPGYTITLRYTPAPVRMVVDGDTFDGIAGWEEWIVLDAAIKALNKEESDVQVLMAQRADIEGDIQRLADGRDQAFGHRIIDVGRMRDTFPGPSVPRYRLGPSTIEILWGPTPNWGFW